MISDNFEILRDTRALYLRQLASLLRDSLLLSAADVTAVQQVAGEYFDEMVSSKGRGSFRDEVDGLTSSRITLVGEDDLEFGIRVDNFTARLFEATGSTLWKLHLRFMTVLRRPDLPKGDNPVGPKGIADGLREMFAKQGAIPLDNKLDLLDKIEDYLVKNLPAVYDTVETFLGKSGIETAQTNIVTSPESPQQKAPGGNTGVAPESINALIALQTALLSRLPVAPVAAAFPSSQTGTIQQQIGGSTAAANLLSQASMDRLLHRLSELDRAADYRNPTLQMGDAPDNTELFPTLFKDETASRQRSLNSSELGIPAHAPEGLAIDTLSLIFEAIFDDPALPDALKAVLSSLQIATLKLAMRDTSLFSETAHPARQVIDKMANAMLGLPLDTPNRHPVCLKLFEIAGKLRSDFAADPTAFSHAAEQLDKLQEERKQEVIAAAQAYLPLLQQLDRCDQVADETKAATEVRVPVDLVDFFQKSWPQVMQQIETESGSNSSIWQDHKNAMNKLLWSFEPKTDLEQRKELSSQLPFVLKTLKGGMVRIGMAPAAQQRVLDICFDLQTQALRGIAPQTVLLGGDTPEAETPTPRREPIAGELKVGSLTLATLDFPEPVPAVSVPCQVGNWIGRSGEWSRLPRMVCFVSPESQRHLLFNPHTGTALAVHSVILSRQLNSGEAVLLGKESLFERAAARALKHHPALPA